MRKSKTKLWIDFINEQKENLKTSVIYTLKDLNCTLTSKPSKLRMFSEKNDKRTKKATPKA